MGKVYVIYEITSKIDGRKYVGKRLKNCFNNYYGSGRYIKNAIKKYGKDNFLRKILEEVDGDKEASKAEVKWIRKINPEFNLLIAAQEGFSQGGLHHSEETRKHWSTVRKGISVRNKITHKNYVSISAAVDDSNDSRRTIERHLIGEIEDKSKIRWERI